MSRPDAIDCLAVTSRRHPRARAALLVVLAALAAPARALPPLASRAHRGLAARLGGRPARPQLQAVPGHAHVFYLGDSTARESTVSDAAGRGSCGAARRRPARSTAVVAFTLASHGQTFGMDEQLLAALPATPAGQPAGHRRHRRRAQPLHRPAVTPPAGRRRPARRRQAPVSTRWDPAPLRRPRAPPAQRASTSWSRAGWTAAGTGSGATARQPRAPSTGCSRSRGPRACAR